MDDKKSTRAFLIFSWFISVFSIVVYLGSWLVGAWGNAERGILYSQTTTLSYYSLIETMSLLFATATFILMVLATRAYRKESYRKARFLIIASLLLFISFFAISKTINKMQIQEDERAKIERSNQY